MRGGRFTRYTVYDMLEQKGFFDENAANSYSNSYAGPVPYPKMFYHPQGKRRVTQKAEIINTPYGPEKVGEQTELIYRIANNEEEAKRLLAEGWHDHAGKAMAVNPATRPQVEEAEAAE